MRSQTQEIWGVADCWKRSAAEDLHRSHPPEFRQVNAGVLHKPGEICHDKNDFTLIAADESEHSMIIRKEKLQRAATKSFIAFPHRDHSLHPPEHRVAVVLLRLHVECFVMCVGIDDDWEKQTVRARLGKAGVTVRTPLHRRSNRIAIAE